MLKHIKKSIFIMFLVWLVQPSFLHAAIVLEGTIDRGVSLDGHALLMGELKNTGENALSNVRIIFTIKDQNDTIIDITETYVKGTTMRRGTGEAQETCLLAGEKAGFMAVLDLDANIPFTYTHKITWIEEPLFEALGNAQIKGNIATYDLDGGTDFYGEIQNNGLVPVSYANITFTVKDDTGKVVDVSNAYIMGHTTVGQWGSNESLAQGEYAPFIAYVNIPLKKIETYEYKINWVETPEIFKPIGNPRIPDVSVVVTTSGNLRYLGEIVNTSGTIAKEVSLKFVLKSKNGNVVNVLYADVFGGSNCMGDDTLVCLAPNESAIFKVNTEKKSSDIGEYYYILNWNEDYDFGGVDSDRDGIRNSEDRCSKTPLGVLVDTSGCGDTDQDGIKDSNDACSETPHGAVVDPLGCPFDSDDDGVYDGIDQCENTVTGREVDLDGCSFYQVDDDKDGVGNLFDLCLNTPAHASVDSDGCDFSGTDVKRVPTLSEWGVILLAMLVLVGFYSSSHHICRPPVGRQM